MHIQLVLTSPDPLGQSGTKTGVWLKEVVAPYDVVQDAGAHVTLITPLGGASPLDPQSDLPDAQTSATRRFKADPVAHASLAHSAMLAGVPASAFDTVFYPGGHGLLCDLKARGGQCSQAADGRVQGVVDGGLITGQNPASAGPAAQALLQRLA